MSAITREGQLKRRKRSRIERKEARMERIEVVKKGEKEVGRGGGQKER